jgi:hypothetical protein
VAQTIGAGAFYECTNLTAISLPAAQTIDIYAFYRCTSLETVSLPAEPPSIGTGSSTGIFRNTGSDAITVRVPSSGAVTAYTTAWLVSASTLASGNTNVYGDNHKAVLITDTAQ